MLKKLVYGFCAGALLVVNAFAAHYEFQEGISVNYDFPPHISQEFVNSLFWTIASVCTIHTRDSQDEIYVEILKKSSRINGSNFSQGDAFYMTVHEGDEVAIEAESGGKVRLTNQGLSTITATCAVIA
jgi:hypothetical protein